MNAPDDLNTQIAQRLFGWVQTDPHWWRDAQGAQHYHIPVYATENGYTDPSATALVWRWLEMRLGPDNWQITLEYQYGRVWCRLSDNRLITLVIADGATWPEALCRAALALAEALEKGERGG